MITAKTTEQNTLRSVNRKSSTSIKETARWYAINFQAHKLHGVAAKDHVFPGCRRVQTGRRGGEVVNRIELIKYTSGAIFRSLN